jgi:hypothetical protein
MTTVTLHATLTAVTNGNPIDPSSWVGGASAWKDASDSTYTDTYASFDTAVSSSAFQDSGTSTLDTLVLPSGVTPTAVSVVLRAKEIAATPGGARARMDILTSGNVGFINCVISVPDATPTVYTHPFNSSDYSIWSTTIGGVVSGLSVGGCKLVLRPLSNFGDPSPYHYGIEAYEASVTVDYTGGTLTPSYAPPLRLTGRDDVFGSARSLLGSRSRQGSNRLTGYL